MALGAIATTVFQKQIANNINNAVYGMKMMTTAGQQAMANSQKEAVGELLDIYNTGNYGAHEKDALISERQVRVKKWNAVLDTMNRSEEAQAAKKEQEATL